MAEFIILGRAYEDFVSILIRNGYTVTLSVIGDEKFKVITTDENDKLMEQIEDDNF